MARKGTDLTMFLLGGILLVGVILLVSHNPTVIVKSGGVQFDSVRKHPFDVFSDPYKPPERENP